MITSTQNKQIKEWQKLKRKKGRTKAEAFIIEGYHLVEEAQAAGWTIEAVIVREQEEAPEFIENEALIRVSDHVFKSLTETENPQGIAAVVKIKQRKVRKMNRVLLVDAVQDPGNLGTMIRTADAAGYDAVILGEGSVDVYNDKVIRATQGSLFHIPIIESGLEAVILELQDSDFTVWAAALENAVDYRDVQPADKTALVVGNEGAGIRKEVLNLCDLTVKIPIYGKAESLNVSIAAGILLYHAAKQ